MCSVIVCNRFYFIYILIKSSFNVYFWERERMSRGGAEREGDTEFEAGSRLWVVSTEPEVGLEPTNSKIMTRAGVGQSTDWATQATRAISSLTCFMSVTYHGISLSPGVQRNRGKYNFSFYVASYFWSDYWCRRSLIQPYQSPPSEYAIRSKVVPQAY